jgi:hypothetical protein
MVAHAEFLPWINSKISWTTRCHCSSLWVKYK